MLLGVIAVALLGRPEIATPIFAFVFYLNLPTLATRFHGVPVIVSILFGLVLVLPALKAILIEHRPVVFPAPLGLMLAYLAAALTSTLLSADVSSAAASISLFASEGLVLYFLVVNVIRTTDGLRQVVGALLLSGAVMGAISIWQESTGSYGNLMGGLAQVNEIGFKVGEDLGWQGHPTATRRTDRRAEPVRPAPGGSRAARAVPLLGRTPIDTPRPGRSVHPADRERDPARPSRAGLPSRWPVSS